MTLGPKRRIRKAMERVKAEISHTASRSHIAGALAGEGYASGYFDALCDVELLLNGNIPQRRGYWEVERKS